MPEKRRVLLRIGKVLLITVGTLVALPLVLVTAVFAALAIPPVRNFAVQKGLVYANESLDGMSVKLKSLDRIDPWGLQARGIQLYDEQQREMVNVPWVLVRINPFALVHNTLALTRVEVDGAHVQLYPADPNKVEEPEPDEPPSEPSTFTIRADHVRIRGTSLTTDWSGRLLHAVVGTLAVGGQYGPKPALAINEANVRVTADAEELLRLRTREGSWNADDGGRIALEALVAGAPLTLRADIPALADVDPFPLRSAELRLHNVRRRTLALLGVTDGAELETPIELALDAQSKDDVLTAQLKLHAGKSSVALDARADADAYDLTVGVTPTRLATVAGILPDMKVQAQLEAHATPGFNPDATTMVPEHVKLAWSNVAVDDGAVPAGALQVDLPLPIIRLVNLTLVGMENALAARGEYDLDRSRAQVALDFREFELNHVDMLQKLGLAGLVDGGISANVTPSTLQAKGDIQLLEFAHPSAQVHELNLGFSAAGSLTAPQGQLKLRVAELKAGELRLDEITSDAEVTLRTLAAKLQVRGPDSLMTAELGGQRTANDQMRVQGIGRGTIASKDVRFDLRELLYGEHGLTLQELSLYSGKQTVRVGGSLDNDNVVQAQLNLANLDLGEWTTLVGVEGIVGRLDGVAKVAGTTAEPRIDTTLELHGTQYRSELPIDAKLWAKGDLATRKAELKLTLEPGEELAAKRKARKEMSESSAELSARANVSVQLPKRPADLAKAAEKARIQADIEAHLPMEQLSAVAGDDLAGLEGVLDLTLTANGTIDAPELATEVKARLKLPEADGDPEEALRLTANVTKNDAKVGLWTGDAAGELLTLNGELAWPGDNPRAALQDPAALQNAKFTLQTELKPRRLDTLQGVFAYFSKLYALSLPLRAGAKISLKGNEGNLDGDIKLQAVVFGDKLDGRCALGTQSAIDLDAKLKQDKVDAQIFVRTDDGGSVRGDVAAQLDLGPRKEGESMLGPTKVTLQGKEIAIHKLPGLCNLAAGRASFAVDASGLGKQRPKLDLTANVRDLRAQSSVGVDVDTKLTAGGNSADLNMQLSSQQKPIGSITARVPLSYPDGTTPTVLPTAPVAARVRFNKLPLANFAAFTEAVGSVKGTASADIAVSGKLSDPYPAGYVQLEDVNLSIAALAQPVHDINGRIEIKGRSVKIPKLTARDQGGKLMVEGFASLQEDLQGNAGLYLEADKFPIRQQGTIVGELTLRTRLDMKIPQDLQAQAQLKILDGRIWLTGDRGKNVQSLDAHPDVRFADEKVEHEATHAEEQAAGKATFALASLKMKTEHDLWLMHKDFEIQVGVDLGLGRGEDGRPKLKGEATITRGELRLMSKPFKLEKGAIRFTGDMPPDPELDLKAIFQPPTGKELIVQISGRGSAPVLEFSGAASNVGEAVAVLTGSNSQSNSGNPSGDMARVAADMTAGLLIMAARREYGDWVPMISVDTGGDTGRASARAGFDASKLIPPWLEGFAKSAYVEGIVGQTANSGSGVGVGVKLEVALPRDFITSLGYGPGNGWSTDVAWSP